MVNHKARKTFIYLLFIFELVYIKLYPFVINKIIKKFCLSFYLTKLKLKKK